VRLKEYLLCVINVKGIREEEVVVYLDLIPVSLVAPYYRSEHCKEENNIRM
jgi:hypothetical protein